MTRPNTLFLLTLILALAACDPFSADPGDSGGCPSEGCTISGHVETETGRALEEVKITVRAGSHRLFGETDRNGNYSIIGAVMTRDYVVTPSKGPWEFDPPDRMVNDIMENTGSINFVAAHVESFDISGQVIDMHGPMANVLVLLTGYAEKSVLTNVQGAYAFRSLRGREDYTVSPSKEGYTFEPPELHFTYLDSTFDDEDFLGTETK